MPAACFQCVADKRKKYRIKTKKFETVLDKTVGAAVERQASTLRRKNVARKSAQNTTKKNEVFKKT